MKTCPKFQRMKITPTKTKNRFLPLKYSKFKFLSLPDVSHQVWVQSSRPTQNVWRERWRKWRVTVKVNEKTCGSRFPFSCIFHWFISRKHRFAKQGKFAHFQSNLGKSFGGELWSWKETKETRWICAESPKCEPQATQKVHPKGKPKPLRVPELKIEKLAVPINKSFCALHHWTSCITFWAAGWFREGPIHDLSSRHSPAIRLPIQ